MHNDSDDENLITLFFVLSIISITSTWILSRLIDNEYKKHVFLQIAAEIKSLLKEFDNDEDPIGGYLEYDYLCPIDYIPMSEPVRTALSTKCYERESIERWLKIKKTDPLSGLSLKHSRLTPDYDLQQKILRKIKFTIEGDPDDAIHLHDEPSGQSSPTKQKNLRKY